MYYFEFFHCAWGQNVSLCFQFAQTDVGRWSCFSASVYRQLWRGKKLSVLIVILNHALKTFLQPHTSINKKKNEKNKNYKKLRRLNMNCSDWPSGYRGEVMQKDGGVCISNKVQWAKISRCLSFSPLRVQRETFCGHTDSSNSSGKLYISLLFTSNLKP